MHVAADFTDIIFSASIRERERESGDGGFCKRKIKIPAHFPQRFIWWRRKKVREFSSLGIFCKYTSRFARPRNMNCGELFSIKCVFCYTRRRIDRFRVPFNITVRCYICSSSLVSSNRRRIWELVTTSPSLSVAHLAGVSSPCTWK